MVDFKKTKGVPSTTVTRNIHDLDKQTGNVYQSVMVIAKRANQIAEEIKEELDKKLEEFSSYTDNLEEVFENQEQIEISKFYEKLPKPTLYAIEEFLNGELEFEIPDEETTKE
jgi:DNA-directed RNA polymerase subunit K/omega